MSPNTSTFPPTALVAADVDEALPSQIIPTVSVNGENLRVPSRDKLTEQFIKERMGRIGHYFTMQVVHKINKKIDTIFKDQPLWIEKYIRLIRIDTNIFEETMWKRVLCIGISAVEGVNDEYGKVAVNVCVAIYIRIACGMLITQMKETFGAAPFPVIFGNKFRRPCEDMNITAQPIRDLLYSIGWLSEPDIVTDGKKPITFPSKNAINMLNIISPSELRFDMMRNKI
jgi:hypothetical protein